jgi:phosphate-selective porin OprO/OprP
VVRIALLLLVTYTPLWAAGKGESTLESDTIDFSLASEIDRYLHEAEQEEAPLRASWEGIPLVESPFNQFRIHLRGRMLMDSVWRTSDDFAAEETEDDLYIRQFRMGFGGHLHHSILFLAELEFFSSAGEPRIQDVFIGFDSKKFWGILMAGHMREVFSIDGITPIPFHAFLERASPTRAFALGRNSGFRLENFILNGSMTWCVGVFQDSGSNGDSLDAGAYHFTARVTGLPIRNRVARERLHLGLSATYRKPTDDQVRFRSRPGVATGPRFVNTGYFPATRDRRLALEFAYLRGRFTIQSEVFLVNADGLGTDADFHGWYVWASWWLTGERRNYNEQFATWGRVMPKRPFWDGHGGAGAFELTFRYDYTDLEDGDIRGGIQDLWTLGLNWHTTPNSRIVTNLIYMDVEDGPLGSGTLLTFAMRFQVDF